MKKWAVLTIGLYAATLLVLAVPVVFVAFEPEAIVRTVPFKLGDLEDEEELQWLRSEVFGFAPFWIFLAVMVISQALLLFTRVRVDSGVTMKPRHLWVPVVTAGTLMVVLLAGLISAVLAVVYGDKASPSPSALWTMLGLLVLGWVFWLFLFRRLAGTREPRDFLDRTTRTLFYGSAAELVVAVTCHIVVRRRGDCSAPFGTFLGIAAGLAVMLLSFGPGVLYLFSARKRRMFPRRPQEK